MMNTTPAQRKSNSKRFSALKTYVLRGPVSTTFVNDSSEITMEISVTVPKEDGYQSILRFSYNSLGHTSHPPTLYLTSKIFVHPCSLFSYL